VDNKDYKAEQTPPRFGGINMRLETLAKGYYCGHDKRREYVINNNETWKQLWEKTYTKSGGPEPCPAVDFTKDMFLLFIWVNNALGDMT